ncbi:hypothetical protein CCACVL1_29939, partial [Corchorus capsularis]
GLVLINSDSTRVTHLVIVSESPNRAAAYARSRI